MRSEAPAWLASLLLLAAASLPARAAYPVAGEIILANGFDRPTRYRGGANYLWHDLIGWLNPVSGDGGCLREPFGLLANYGVPAVRTSAQSQLATMHARGMRTLAIGALFRDDPPTGTLIDAGDPVAVSAATLNLDLMLQDIAAAGFERVLFRFFPQGRMSPSGGSFDAATLDLYKNMIAALRVPLAAGPLPYLIDLGVEGAPADEGHGLCSIQHGGEAWKCPNNEAWSDAARELWRWYRDSWGVADTVGFSFISTPDKLRNRVRHMKYVYDGKYPGDWPAHLAVDLYGEGDRDAADRFVTFTGLVNDYSADFGFAVEDLIISEIWYNDPLVAAPLASAIAATGQSVRYLVQWPLDRGALCEGVSEGPPYAWNMYPMFGF